MVTNAKSSSTKEIFWLQWIGGTAAMIVLFITGLMRGWSSPYLTQLMAEDSPLPITTAEASWVASLLNLGRLAGAILGFCSVYFFGSKKTLVVTGFPIAIGWLVVIWADSVIWIYIARISLGLGFGIVYSSFPLYLGEISSPKIRGSLVTLAMSGVNLGILGGNVMGAYVSMAIFSYVSLVPTVVCILVFLWLPESPHDLVKVNKMKDAKKSIERYNPTADAEVELQHVRDFVNMSCSVTLKDKLKEFNLPHNRRALLIILLLFVFMQFSGLNTVIFYMETILTDAKVTVITPATLVIIVNAIGAAAGFIVTYAADEFGRKTLLIGSSAGIFVTTVGLGVHFTLIDQGLDPSRFQWLPIASMIGYQLAFPFGHAIVSNMVLSELFSARIKSIAACFSGITGGAFAFVSSKTYQPVVDTFGEAYEFWMHAVIMVLCIIFALTLMPETKRKTLQEIQDELVKRAISK